MEGAAWRQILRADDQTKATDWSSEARTDVDLATLPQNSASHHRLRPSPLIDCACCCCVYFYGCVVDHDRTTRSPGVAAARADKRLSLDKVGAIIVVDDPLREYPGEYIVWTRSGRRWESA